MTLWINGQFVARDEARISAFDAGLLHAVGLFETMIAVGDTIFRLDDHLARLARSAKALRLSDAIKTNPLASAVQHVVEHAGLDRTRIRLTITGGDLNLLQSSRNAPTDPTIIISAQPATEYPQEFFSKGIGVIIADARLNPLDPFAGHKTLNYWPRLSALQDAAAKQAGEAIWFAVTNHLASGSVSNIFLVKDGTLYTPIAHGEETDSALQAPVLPGITRNAVIEFADALSIGTAKQMLDIDDLLGADEIFLSNSSWGILPVVAVEAETIATGAPGPITCQLRRRWLEETRLADHATM